MPLPIGFVEGATALITVTKDGMEVKLHEIWTRAMCDAASHRLDQVARAKTLDARATASKVKRLIKEEVDASKAEADSYLTEAGVEVIRPQGEYDG